MVLHVRQSFHCQASSGVTQSFQQIEVDGLEAQWLETWTFFLRVMLEVNGGGAGLTLSGIDVLRCCGFEKLACRLLVLGNLR